jgi:hypothetical protein
MALRREANTKSRFSGKIFPVQPQIRAWKMQVGSGASGARIVQPLPLQSLTLHFFLEFALRSYGESFVGQSRDEDRIGHSMALS